MANEIQPSSRVVRVPASRGPGNPPPQGSMTPKEIAVILRRHLFMIVFLTILGTVAGGGSWYLLKMYFPGYTSVGTIEVLPPITTIPGDITTTQTNKDIFFEFRSTKAFRLSHQGFLQDLLELDKIREMKWFQKYETIADKVEYLEDHLSASAARDRSLITVSMTASDPKEAQETAQQAILLFLDQEDGAAKIETGAELATVRAQRGKLQGELDSLEENMRGLREGTQFTLREQNFRDYIDDILSDLQSQADALNRDVQSTQQAVNILTKRKEREDFDEVVRNRVEQDRLAQEMRLKVDSLEVELKRLRSQFGNDHKRVMEISHALEEQKKSLSDWKAKIGELYKNAELVNAVDQLSMLNAQLTSQQQQITKARNDYRDMHRLRAGYEKKVSRRDELRANLEELDNKIGNLETVLANSTLSKVKMGMLPSVPLEMSSPNALIFIPGGLMLGFMLGVGLAFAVEMLNDLLRSPSEVVKYMRVPLLGTICHKSEDRAVKRLNLYHVVREAPYSLMSEAFRQFRTRLMLSSSDSSPKTLLVTSGDPGDGKTTVAVNTAYTFVADGKRVLLIDTNFRKPSTSNLFERKKTDDSDLEHPDSGLSNYLMGQCEMSSVIRGTDQERLDVIDSGPLPLNPSELLGSDKMVDLINAVQEKYDYVIIDGPPLLVSESKILASEVDGAILVFNAEHTRRGAAQRALRELNEANANVLGTVLIGVKSMKGGYFHERYDTYKRYNKVKPSLMAR